MVYAIGKTYVEALSKAVALDVQAGVGFRRFGSNMHRVMRIGQYYLVFVAANVATTLPHSSEPSARFAPLHQM